MYIKNTIAKSLTKNTRLPDINIHKIYINVGNKYFIFDKTRSLHLITLLINTYKYARFNPVIKLMPNLAITEFCVSSDLAAPIAYNPKVL